MELICLGRIVLAGFCGGILGYERQRKKKKAGMRTHVIVAISSALMVVLSKYGFQDVLGENVRVDPSRIAAAVVTAIGFLGSGMIIFRNNNVRGLTTSAGIWATVGVGMAMGAGMYMVGFFTAVMILFVEMFLGRKSILPRKKKTASRKMMIEYRLMQGSNFLAEIEKEAAREGGEIISIRTKRGEDGQVKVRVLVKEGENWDGQGFVERMISWEQVLQVKEWL